MEDINFNDFQNTSLSMNTRGYIDQDEMSISVIMPPSLNLAANKLIAECRIRKESYHENEEYFVLMNRFWNNNDTVTLDREDFDPKWKGDSSFVNEYTMKIEREFLSKLELFSPWYSSSPNFSIRIRFNDLAEPAFDPPTLDEMDFIAGLSGVNFTTPGVVQITTDTPVPQPLPAAGNAYNWTLVAPLEGPVNVTFLAGSVLHGIPLTFNSASNTLNMVYDATAPLIPTAPDDAVTVSNLDNTITDYHDAKLTLAFKESSDFSDLTPRDKLRYSFQVEFPAGFTYPIPYQGNIDVPYQSSYTWDFDEMPFDLQNLLKFNNDLMFKVSVHDLAYNYSNYIPGNQIYLGPSTP
jgi:hypothetical protein